MRTINEDEGSSEVSSLAVLLDNARAAIAAAREAGLDVQVMAVNPVDLQTVRQAKKFEERTGLPLRILGVAIEPDSGVSIGTVRL